MVPPALRHKIQRAIQKLNSQREFRSLSPTQWKRAEALAYSAIKKQCSNDPYLSNNHLISSPAYTSMIERLLLTILGRVRHRLF